MRVIAGSAKGRTLASVPGAGTRPITDRVKSALFSILAARDMIAGRRYLDLFAGTGAVGIEALSREADAATFCEIDRAALRTIRRNLEATGLAYRAQIIAGDAFAFLARPVLEPFDVIYIAPPQYQGLWSRALAAVTARPGILSGGGLVFVQIFPKEWREPDIPHLALVERRRYGSTELLIYAARDEEA